MMLFFKHMTPGALVLIGLVCISCAAHQPGVQTWRLAGAGDNGAVLIPPGVRSADLTRRTLTTDVAAGAGCPKGGAAVSVEPRGHVRVTVDRAALLKQPAGWLSLWAARLEASGCIGAGEAPKLAELVAESVPLPPNEIFRLLYAGDRRTGRLDLGAGVRLQVTTPIVKEDADPDALIVVAPEVSGNGNSLSLTASSNLLGYEVAFYEVQPKAARAGNTIVPMFAERHIDGKTERVAGSANPYFRFGLDASYYRLLYKSDQTDFTALVAAGSSLAQVDEISKQIEEGIVSCREPELHCVPVPRRVALNAFVAVTMNGREQLVSLGATLGEAIRESGERQAAAVLPRLSIRKTYRGQPVEIQFSRADSGVLDMILSGGEIISWTAP